MSGSFYFYDVETSGFNPRTDRIMQFAGQRTDMDLNPIGEPYNILIKMTPDILPQPDAILVTSITPQKTIAEGVSEAEFLKYFCEKVVTPGTILAGFNNIRFDDEFMRFTLWRNFRDAYEWQWKDGCSRWDLLDVVRMTRALRPAGINWPFGSDGKASNKLELITSVNNLDHVDAHDALSDVRAVIALSRLIKTKQPKLFDYLLNLRGKDKVAALVGKDEPVVYTSGRYPAEYEKTTIAIKVAETPEGRGALMYDLRIDPEPFLKMSVSELAKAWQARGEDVPYFPVKVLSYNRCPAVAPMSVLTTTESKSARLRLDPRPLQYLPKIKIAKGFGEKLVAALETWQPKKQSTLAVDEQAVDGLLYEGFVAGRDKITCSAVRAADADSIFKLHPEFVDERLKLLFPLYKARNFPKKLDESEQAAWEKFRRTKLLEGGSKSLAAQYFKRLEELATQPKLSEEQKYLLEELNLYGQSILPAA